MLIGCEHLFRCVWNLALIFHPSLAPGLCWSEKAFRRSSEYVIQNSKFIFVIFSLLVYEMCSVRNL